MGWNPYHLTGASCMDPLAVFESFDTFATCFTIFGLADNTLSAGEEGYYLNENSTFGALIGDCLTQYCQVPDPDLRGCSSAEDISDGYYRLLTYPKQEFKTATCSSVDNNVNQDIGGVGVLLSFVMQSAILLYIYFAVLILKFIPAVTRCVRRTKKTRSILQVQFGQHHFSVLKSMLVEFQEAQCFFMLSFQCAALIALAAGPQVFEATSLMQLSANISMAKSVAFMGILPITYGVWILHRVNLHSWYISLWSAITIVVSSVTLHLCKVVPRADNLQQISTADRLDKCGYHPPPVIYCSSTYTSNFVIQDPFEFIESILNYVCVGIYGLLLLKRLAPYPKRWFNRKPWFQATYHRAHPWLVSKGVRFLTTTVAVLIELLLSFFNVSYILLVTARNLPTINLNSWSFGQIIAVTIWAPIISKYLYWALFGTDSYSAIRFPSPYKIIRVKSINEEDHNDEDRLFINLPSTSDLALDSKSKRVMITDVELKAVDDSSVESIGTRRSRVPL